MSAYFVTSCGTERGKTHVAESLIKEWLLEGLSVDVLKPIVSGFEINTLVDSDTYRLLSAIRDEVCQESIERISPWRFSAPLSPPRCTSPSRLRNAFSKSSSRKSSDPLDRWGIASGQDLYGQLAGRLCPRHGLKGGSGMGYEI